MMGEQKKKKGLGVPVAEPTVGLSATSPQPSASGLSTTIPNAVRTIDLSDCCGSYWSYRHRIGPFTVERYCNKCGVVCGLEVFDVVKRPDHV